jgi:hypothetical protein
MTCAPSASVAVGSTVEHLRRARVHALEGVVAAEDRHVAPRPLALRREHRVAHADDGPSRGARQRERDLGVPARAEQDQRAATGRRGIHGSIASPAA